MEKINTPKENIFDMIKRLDLGEKSILEVVTEIDKLRRDKVSLLADVRRLVEAAKKYKEENGHWNYCNAIHGPEHETWTVEEDCNCELKPFKQAIAAVERHFVSEGGDPSEEKNNRLG